jgi:hypothetical protein
LLAVVRLLHLILLLLMPLLRMHLYCCLKA